MTYREIVDDELLERAVFLLSEGFPIPIDLHADLLERGYDVHAIERQIQ